MPTHFHRLAGLLSLFFAAMPAPAATTQPVATTVAGVFSDHMVLQRDLPVPVWGRAEAGTVVTVNVAGQTHTDIANGRGEWMVRLNPLAVAKTPIEMTVADANGPVATFKDVLVGDVWLAGGQSNMEMKLSNAADGDAEVAKANEPNIRLLLVRRTNSSKPLTDPGGKWAACTPASAEKFSAVAYYFAREIQKREGVPIGVIGSYSPGTKIEPWISFDGYLIEPALKRWGDNFMARMANLPALQKQYEDVTLPAWQAKYDEWDREVGTDHKKNIDAWNKAVAEAKATGDKAPPKPKPARPEPRKPDAPAVNQGRVGSLYNGMIAPVVPFGIRGVIWYQGESNADAPDLYHFLFPGLIGDWRRQWNQPGTARDFPFLFVQLANFEGYPKTDWAALREAQFKTQTVAKNTAMVTAIDVGEVKDIHPKNKKDVGLRLARAAEHVVYGHADVAFQGPTLKSVTIANGAATVVFDHAAGLHTRGEKTNADAPAGFQIAGADGVFVPARAKLAGPDTVVVSSERVKTPIYVRYAWAHAPQTNLYNGDGLPALPFRTDNFPPDFSTTQPATEPATGPTPRPTLGG